MYDPAGRRGLWYAFDGPRVDYLSSPGLDWFFNEDETEISGTSPERVALVAGREGDDVICTLQVGQVLTRADLVALLECLEYGAESFVESEALPEPARPEWPFGPPHPNQLEPCPHCGHPPYPRWYHERGDCPEVAK